MMWRTIKKDVRKEILDKKREKSTEGGQPLCNEWNRNEEL